MIELTSVQLRFEFFCKEVDSNREIFNTSHEYDVLLMSLKEIENVLNNIVNEYENLFKLFPNTFFLSDIQFIPIEKLPELRKFLDRSFNAVDPEQNIRQNHKKVSGILLRIILSVNA
jgi:hypothetical protein